jgi:DNA replication and repair protein RecF
MAELDYMRTQVGEWPILLLDDATSELDDLRRRAILELARREEQVFITTADPAHLAALLDSGAQRWAVAQGHLSPLSYERSEAPQRYVAEPPTLSITQPIPP